jgi:acyl-coenzyme A thioesterase PaaI-like protein
MAKKTALTEAGEKLRSFITGPVLEKLPETMRDTVLLRTFGFLKIPMLFYISPTVVESSDEKCVVKIPLNRRTQNHLHSMYFGALAAGADCAGGLIAMRTIEQQAKGKVALIFKDFHADFLKRAEGDVHFTCTQGAEIRELVKKAIETGERQNLPVHLTATVPSKLGAEPVAQFTLTLSLKKK